MVRTRAAMRLSNKNSARVKAQGRLHFRLHFQPQASSKASDPGLGAEGSWNALAQSEDDPREGGKAEAWAVVHTHGDHTPCDVFGSMLFFDSP